MAIIIDFKTRKVIGHLQDSGKRYISKCGNFDYTELHELVSDAENKYGVSVWKAAIGITSYQLWLRITGKTALKSPIIDRLIEFLEIPDADISRVFFRVA